MDPGLRPSPSRSPPSRALGRRCPPMRILVAEDDTTSRALTLKLLEKLGHQPVAFTNGVDAFDSFRRDPYAIVVTDWMMPKMDGLELTRRIRGLRTQGYTWVIMLTARDFGANYVKTMQEGVDDFITKPLDTQFLQVRLAVAERVCTISRQAEAIAEYIPICMHCKSVRNTRLEDWQRLEHYVHEESSVDFSHVYCPDCYYDHSLAPELRRWRPALPATPLGKDAPFDTMALLDRGWFGDLAAFDHQESPGLLPDLLDGLVETGRRFKQDIVTFANPALRTPEVSERIGSFRARCADVGAMKLVRLIDESGTIGERDHRAFAQKIVSETDAMLGALRREVESLYPPHRRTDPAEPVTGPS